MNARSRSADRVEGIKRRGVDLSAVLALVFAEVTSGTCAHYGGKQTAAFLRQTAKNIEGASPLAGLALYAAAPMGRA